MADTPLFYLQDEKNSITLWRSSISPCVLSANASMVAAPLSFARCARCEIDEPRSSAAEQLVVFLVAASTHLLSLQNVRALHEFPSHAVVAPYLCHLLYLRYPRSFHRVYSGLNKGVVAPARL